MRGRAVHPAGGTASGHRGSCAGPGRGVGGSGAEARGRRGGAVAPPLRSSLSRRRRRPLCSTAMRLSFSCSFSFVALVMVAVSAVGCGGSDSPPSCGGGDVLPSYELTASGITVEITTAPFGVQVLDGEGTEVLATATPGATDVPDGYAAATWTTGTLQHHASPTPGYDHFAAHLDPWRDLEVTGADATSTSVTLHLRTRDEQGVSCVTQTFTVRDSTLRVEASLDADATPPRAWSAGFTTTSDEGFLGFGERFTHTNHRGYPVYSWAEEGGIGTGEGNLASPTNPFPNGEEMAYYPVPFFVSTRGYGFWLDTTWRSQFELATERDDAWRVWETGPSLAYEVYTPTPGRRAAVAVPAHRPLHRRDRAADGGAGVGLRAAAPVRSEQHAKRRVRGPGHARPRPRDHHGRRCAPLLPQRLADRSRGRDQGVDRARPGPRLSGPRLLQLDDLTEPRQPARRPRRPRASPTATSWPTATGATRTSGSSPAARPSSSTSSTSPRPRPAPGTGTPSTRRPTSATRAGCTTSASTSSPTWSHPTA